MSERRIVEAGGPWADIVGYSRAVRVGDRISVSGTTAALGDAVCGGEDPYLQTQHALHTAIAALEELGGTTADVVRTRIFVTDIDHWREVGRAHGEIFATIKPATTMVQVARLIDPRMLVEIELEATVRA